jgi:glyoxylase-like metal-dependent hydrolase (beta-lactamase superfamily II)/rhodanese-related sulfurtransferase
VIRVETIETTGLGDRSYLAHDGTSAIVIDPQRDIDRVLELAASLGVSVEYVFETHMHNDYVTGGLALAGTTGARYGVSANEPVAFEHVDLVDGQVVEVGSMRVRVMATPGHTPNHLSYVLSDADGDQAVFTGGSMLLGATGRTDLISAEMTDQLTRSQYASVRRIAEEVAGEAAVCPTHGFGSFCSATNAVGKSSTVAQQRTENPALTLDEETFVKTLLAGLVAYPRYYAYMGARNLAGASAPDLSEPTKVDASELKRRIDAGEWVVDLRTRTAYTKGHIPGTISVELCDSFVTYLGWTMGWETPVTLLAESADQIAEAQRAMVRIGIERPAGAAVGSVESLAGGERLRSYPRATFADLAAALEAAPEKLVVVDSRRPDEYDAGHIKGALPIPFYDIEARADEVPSEADVWVHCAGGFRASIAASLLDRAGRRVTLVDDDFSRARESGLELV